MAIYRVQGPDGAVHRFEGPDDATPQQVESFAAQQFAAKQFAPSQEKPYDPTQDMSTTDRLLAGIGKGMVDLGRGAGERLGLVSPQDVAEARKRDAPLMNTGAGFAGNIVGNLAAFAPAAMIPGANSVAGAAAIGGLSGALQPTTEDESALKNTAMGAAIGGGSQAVIGKAADMARKFLTSSEAQGVSQAAQNSVRDATLKASQGAGYAIPPSQAGAGLGGRILEGLSGKYKTNQLATIKNQNVTDTLARKALGMGADEPITREAMQAIRNDAFQQGYAPLANAGAIETDKVFQGALDKIVDTYKGASRSFPGAVKNDVMARVDGLRTGSMDVGDALKMTQILRDEASAAYAQGDKGLGKATKLAANAIEDQIERALQAAGENGQQLLKSFRDARQLMAKSHSVEQAIVAEGGKVNARVLGAALQKGKPLSDELKTIGAFANNFKDVAGVPQSGFANPFTIMDFGFGSATGSPALPMARVAARYGIMSPQFQRNFVHPSYGPGVLTKGGTLTLEELRRLGAGGLLGSANSAQQ